MLTPNNHLQKARRLYEGELIGPESILAFVIDSIVIFQLPSYTTDDRCANS